MSIKVKLNVILAEKNIKSITLAEKIGISPVNLSKINTGKLKAIKISTLNAICRELDCQPGDIFKFEKED
jgi:putative transcriptional regulator